MTWYRKMEPFEVEWRTRRLAEQVLAYAVRDLGLGTVVIQWVSPVSERDANQCNMRARALHGPFVSKRRLPCTETSIDAAGWVNALQDGQLFLRADMDVDVLAHTILHEARHLWQGQRYRPPLTVSELEVTETDAERYAVEHVARVTESLKKKGAPVCLKSPYVNESMD